MSNSTNTNLTPEQQAELQRVQKENETLTPQQKAARSMRLARNTSSKELADETGMLRTAMIKSIIKEDKSNIPPDEKTQKAIKTFDSWSTQKREAEMNEIRKIIAATPQHTPNNTKITNTWDKNYYSINQEPTYDDVTAVRTPDGAIRATSAQNPPHTYEIPHEGITYDEIVAVKTEKGIKFQTTPKQNVYKDEHEYDYLYSTIQDQQPTSKLHSTNPADHIYDALQEHTPKSTTNSIKEKLNTLVQQIKSITKSGSAKITPTEKKHGYKR